MELQCNLQKKRIKEYNVSFPIRIMMGNGDKKARQGFQRQKDAKPGLIRL